jgi:hypothetical protein
VLHVSTRNIIALHLILRYIASEMPDVSAPPRKRQAVRAPSLVGHRFGNQHFEILISALSEGLTITEAAKRTGFSRNVVYEWFGRNPTKHDELKRRMKPVYLERIRELGEAKEDWRAYAWMLERMFPNEFSLVQIQRFELNGSVDHHVHMIPESELARMAQLTREIEAEVL